jgi:hypothetical protein
MPEEAIAALAQHGARIQAMFFSTPAEPFVPVPVELQK